MNRIEEHRNAGKRDETWREGTRKTGRETSSKYDFDDDRPSGLTAFRRRVNPFISVAPFYIRAHANSLGFPRGFFLSSSFLCALFLSLFFFFPLFFSLFFHVLFSLFSRSSTSVCRFVSCLFHLFQRFPSILRDLRES